MGAITDRAKKLGKTASVKLDPAGSGLKAEASRLALRAYAKVLSMSDDPDQRLLSEQIVEWVYDEDLKAHEDRKAADKSKPIKL